MENQETKETKAITGTIDPELVNIHMKAASKDDSRRAIKCLLMKHKDGELHLITTNGRILLHTTISELCADLDGAPDFEVMVEVTRKLKKGRKTIPNVLFSIEGDKVFFRGYKTFDAFEIYKDDTFPKTDEIERSGKAKVAQSNYKAIMPDWLAIIYEYVGYETYTKAKNETGVENGASFYERYNGTDNRLAIVMPLRQV